MRRYRKYLFILLLLAVVGGYSASRVSAAATITVNSAADNLTAGDGNCTLREAMTNSNADSDSTSGDCTAGSGDDIIAFNIAPLDGSVKIISPSSALPNITDTVTIDGSTQDNADCSTHTIKIEIDYSGYVGLAMGLLVGAGDGASGTTIKGLSIVNATQHGIFSYSPNTTIACNNIGVRADGTTAGGMDGVGVLLYPGSTASVVGGSSVSDRNVISGNTGSNIAIHQDNVTISGNYVGTDATGNSAIVGGNNGIAIYSSNNIIGGTTSAERNVISGNGWTGMGVADAGSGGPTGNIIKGNYIGLGANGTTALGNSGAGVYLVDGASSNTIGGDSAEERNVISGNNGHGVNIEGSTTNSNTVIGNYIGTNAAGTGDLGNDYAGIILDNSPSNTVGGTASGERNVISGNASDGITLSGDNADNNTIQSNYIGTNAAGTGNLANTSRGIFIQNGADSTLIGGTTAGSGNLIRFNNDNGVSVTASGSSNNSIIGNSLYSNANPNIDLGDDGDTANDANDADTGPNDLLNAPVWVLYDDDSGDTEVTYDLDVPAGDYRIETFSGNGKTLIDSQDITHTGSGVENFSNTITGVGFLGIRMTVTEIDGGLASGFGATSEYSEAYSNSSGTSTITVNSTADDTDDDGECTLREAIIAANEDTDSGSSDGECFAGSNEDTIEFDISGSGVHTIQPTGGGLPPITSSNTTIDGYSQTGSVENSGDYSTCFEGTIKIEIDGSLVDAGNSGITVAADDISMRGLAINRFSGAGNGVSINSGDDIVVAGNIVGLDTAGAVDRGNGTSGVYVSSSVVDVTIGGSNPQDRNIISGNSVGLSLRGNLGSTIVSGNCIGVGADGTTDLGNANDGVGFSNADNVLIGGTSAGARNIISGNDQNGLNQDVSSSGVVIRGNYVGLGADGVTDVGNNAVGLYINGAQALVGGTVTGSRNVISGNAASGVNINDATLQGNYIGLSADGESVIPNGYSQAASVAVSSNAQIGGTTDTARNYIASNNVSVGISITGTSAFGGSSNGGNTIQGNYIGTNTAGEVEAGFGTQVGIALVFDALNNIIGGSAEGAGNIVAGNREGIASFGISGASFIPLNNSFLGNSIHSSNGGNAYGVVSVEGIGIDLLDNPTGNFTDFTELGVNTNDGGDGDTSTNDYLNYPIIDSTSASAGQLDIQFDLDVPDDAPNGYRIEFFANSTGDASGNGEGQIYLASTDVDGSGDNQMATVTIDPGRITTGAYDITATTTERDNSSDGFGATSEFSTFLDNQQIIQPLDNDNDGVNDAVEDAGPNGGDGNDDGTPDNEQASVATILDNTGENYLTLELDSDGACNTIDDFEATTEAGQADQDGDYNYPLGLNRFVIPCSSSVDGTILYHGHDDLADYTHRKFGPTTPSDSSTNDWFDAGFTYGTTTIDGSMVATASFTLTDDELGDDTADDNSIVDDNGPGLEVETTDSVVDSISSAVSDALSATGMSQYGVYVLAGILIAGGSSVIIKRKYFSKASK